MLPVNPTEPLVLYNPRTTKEIICGAKLQFQLPAVNATVKDSCTCILSAIRFPSPEEVKGKLICNLDENGVKSWEEYFPEVFGLAFIPFIDLYPQQGTMNV